MEMDIHQSDSSRSNIPCRDHDASPNRQDQTGDTLLIGSASIGKSIVQSMVECLSSGVPVDFSLPTLA